MIQLTEKDKEIIRHICFPKIVTLSSGSYLVKSDFKNKSVNELIGKKLADLFGLVCPSTKLVEVDGEKYILSEDLNQYGDFITGLEIFEIYKDSIEENTKDEKLNNISDNSLYSAWAFLENSYPKEVSKNLMDEVLKMYIFDILFFNYDRDVRNWGILTQATGEPNIVIFDHEFMFESDKENEFSKTVKLTTNLNDRNPSVYEDFKYFLKESSRNFIDLFMYYFNLITPEFLRKMIEQIERWNKIEIDTKDSIIENYIKHREKLMNIYEEEMGKGEKHGR